VTTFNGGAIISSSSTSFIATQVLKQNFRAASLASGTARHYVREYIRASQKFFDRHHAQSSPLSAPVPLWAPSPVWALSFPCVPFAPIYGLSLPFWAYHPRDPLARGARGWLWQAGGPFAHLPYLSLALPNSILTVVRASDDDGRHLSLLSEVRERRVKHFDLKSV